MEVPSDDEGLNDGASDGENSDEQASDNGNSDDDSQQGGAKSSSEEESDDDYEYESEEFTIKTYLVDIQGQIVVSKPMQEYRIHVADSRTGRGNS